MENEATANLVLQAISDLNERFKPIDNPLEGAKVRDKCRNIIPLEYAEYELLSLTGGCEKFTANFRVFNFDVQDVDKFISIYIIRVAEQWESLCSQAKILNLHLR